MKTRSPLFRIDRFLFAFAAAALFAAMPEAKAQYQITSLNTTITENFNGMTFSSGIGFSGSLNDNTNTTAAQRNAAWSFINGNSQRSGGNASFNSINQRSGVASAGGFYSAGNNATTTDRSLAMLGVGSTLGANTAGATATFQNTSGGSITSFVLSYTGEQWVSQAARTSSITVSYSLDGSTYTTISGLTFNALSTVNLNATGGTGGTTGAAWVNGDSNDYRTVFSGVTVNLASNVANGSNILIRWFYDGGAGSGSRQMLGIDDVSVTFNGAVPPPPSGGNYWAGAASGGGGSGTWSTAGTNWATGAGGAGRGETQATSGVLIFADAAGTVTVSGGVDVAAGMQFSTTGYSVESSTITLNGASASANAITTDSGVSTTISSVLDGTTGFSKAGAGTLTLSGANTVNGGISLNAGGLSVAADSALGNAASAITFGGGTLVTTAGFTTSRGFSGTGALDIANGTTLTNSGTVNMTALTLANTGTFEMSGASKTLNSLTFSVASTLTNTGAATVLGGNVAANNASGTVVMAGAYDLGTTNRTFTAADGSASTDMQISGAITNTNPAGYLVKAGTGRLELTGDNSGMAGGLQLGSAGSAAAGQLLVAGTNAFGQASFRFNSGTLEASTALTGANALTNSYSIGGRDANAAIFGGANAIEFKGDGTWFTGTNNSTAHLAANNQATLSGVLGTTTNTGVSILFSGTGSLTLAGASANLFTNAVTVSNGLSLILDKDGALGTAASGTTVQSGAELVVDGINYATAEGLTISGTGKGGAGALRANGTSIFAGAILSSGGATIGVDAGGSLLLSGALTGAGVTKAGSGDLTISNASSSFGTLTTGSGTTAIAANATATGLAGSGALNLAGGTFTLNNATAQTFSGAISGAGALVKTGAGTATLSGNSSSFTGATTVTNGTLVVNGNLSGSAVSVGHASLAEGSVLMGTGSVGATTINSNGVISPGNSVGILSVSNTLTWNAGGSYLWEINGTNGPAGTAWDLITVDTATAGDGLGTLNLPGSGQFTINGEAIDAFVFDGDQDYLGNYFLIVEAASISGSLGNLAFLPSGLGLGTWSFSTNATGLYLNYEAPAGVITFTPTGVVTQSESAVTPAGDYSTITGGFAVIIDGVGTLVMTNAANDYTGTTSVLGGTLRANVNAPNSAAGAFGNAVTAIAVGDTGGSDNAALDIGVDGVTIGRAVEVVSGSSGTKTLGTSLTSGTATYSGAVVLGAGAQLTAGGTANAVFSGEISGTAGITKVGDGTVTLSGSTANSFGGAATVSAGTLLLNKSGVEALTTSITVNGGTLMLGAADQIANTATVTLAGGDFDLGSNNEQITTLQLNSGTLVGSGGTLTATSYNLAGGTVNGNLGTGTINASASAALNGTANATTVNITGGTLTLGSASRLTGSTPTLNVSGGGALALSGNESIGTLNLTNGTVSGSGTLTVGSTINARQGTVSANLAGSVGLTKTTASTVTLSGANTFSGAVAVNDGTLILTNGAALSDTAAVTLANTAGAILQISGSETIGSLASVATSAGAVALGANTLTLNQVGDTTYGGTITGTGLLAKTGAGTLTLNRSGAVGADFDISIAGGTVEFSRGGSAISGILGSGNKVLLDGGTVEFSASSGGNGNITFGGIDVRASSSILINRTSAADSHSSSINAPLTFTNNATLSMIYGANVSGGVTTFSGTGGHTLFSNGTLQLGIYGVTISTAIGESGGSYSFTKTGTGTLSLTAANTYTGDTVVSAGELRLTGSGRLSDSSLLSVAGGATAFIGASDTIKGLSGAGTVSISNTFNLTVSNSAADTFSGTITNAGGLVKAGAGTQILTGANTYAGGTTISGGVLSLGNGGAGGSVTGPITNNAALVFNRSDNASYSDAISGSGTVTKSGAGSLTLSGASTYSGATTVSAGTLELSNTTGQALASTTSLSVTNGAVLLISQSNQVNNSASVSLSGGTIARGAGVSEVFGALTLDDDSFLDFGTGATGTLSFTSYTPSALLTVNNFLPGNKLTFTSNLSSDIENSALFSFQGQFEWDWDTTTPNTFTITAIPEPSTYLAAAGLLSLMLWPSRKRLIKDAKKILGLRAPMRDRLAARRA